MTLITACIIARDEEEDLPRCLASLAGVIDEVLVVDTGSTDNTKAVAHNFGARVHDFQWTESFADARNYAIGLASGRWILIIDADEELYPADRDKLRPLLSEALPREPEGAGPVEAYHLPIISFIGSMPPAGLSLANAQAFTRDLRLSLFRNRPGRRFQGAIHEELTGDLGPDRTALAAVRILHYGYLDVRVAAKDKGARNRRLITRELDRRPNDPFLHYSLGAELMGAADYPGALSHFQVALDSWGPEEPRHGDLLAKVALCHLSQGRHEEARKALLEGVRVYPDFTDLWFLLGVLESRAGRSGAGRKCFQRCLTLGPAPPRYCSFSGVDGDRAVLGLALSWVELALAAARVEDNRTLRWLQARQLLLGALIHAPE